MADYYPVLTRAIGGLEQNTAEARRAVYERARQAIVKQLRSYDPPLTESEITKERLGLEEAIRRIESETRQASMPPRSAAPAQRPSFGVEPSPAPASSSPTGTPAEEPAAAPAPPEPARMAGSEGLTKVHAAAAAAASLGAATANAQASASTTRAAFETPAAPRGPAPRLEPSFERPRVPGPLPEPRPDPVLGTRGADFDDPNPHLREPEEASPPRRRAPAIGGMAAILAILALGIGAYLARDQIAGTLGGAEEQVAAPESGPKVADRVAEPSPVPADLARDQPADPVAPAVPAQQEAAAAPNEPAPTTPSDPGSLVAQRAILYDETPDAKDGAAASTGSVVWRTEPVANNPEEVKLVGQIAVPERGLEATISFQRNLDQTLSASHLIEITFTTAPDFTNGGVGNVPGILFKPTEQDGGSALKGMSVKVMKNMFWIGLEKSPADREQNMQAIRSRGWIDLPILYENGRRAVLTIEKGPPGERAFATAFAAWDAAQAPGTPAAATP